MLLECHLHFFHWLGYQLEKLSGHDSVRIHPSKNVNIRREVSQTILIEGKGCHLLGFHGPFLLLLAVRNIRAVSQRQTDFIHSLSIAVIDVGYPAKSHKILFEEGRLIVNWEHTKVRNAHGPICVEDKGSVPLTV